MAVANAAHSDPWSMKVGGGGGGGEYRLCPAGSHMGTIIHLFDVGTQAVPQMDGQIKKLRRLVIVFELKKCGTDGKPFFIGDRLTFSLNEKAKLYQLAVNVLGARFRDGEQFSVAELLGKSVMVSVTHTSKGSGPEAKTYHNIGSVTAFPDELAEMKPKPTVTPSLWSVQEGKAFPPGLDYLPWIYGESVQSQAESSDEWRARGAAAAPADRQPGGDDDIPF